MAEEVRCLPCRNRSCSSCLRAWADEPCECECNAGLADPPPGAKQGIKRWLADIFRPTSSDEAQA